MAEGTDNRLMVQQWLRSVEKARPETPEESDRGLNSNLDYTTHKLLSSQTAQASHVPQRKKTNTLPRITVKEFATQVPLRESTRIHFEEKPPITSGKREKSQSPLPEPTPSQEPPPFNLPKTSQKHPKPLLRALTYGGTSKQKCCDLGLGPQFRSSTSPDLLCQSKSALLLPDLSPCSQDATVAGGGGGGEGGGGELARSCLMQRRSNSDTNLARVGISISPALSPEGSHCGSSNSVHSGQFLSSDLGSPYYNVSPVHSGDEMNSGPGINIATTTASSKNNLTDVTLLSRSDTSGRRVEGSSGEEDNSSGGGGGKGERGNLPPLQQEELGLLSMYVGEHLPQLTLLLGMEESDYENSGTTVGSSQETQALQLLMRWFERGRGGRSELAEALRRAGIGRIAQLLLQGRLEAHCKDQDESPMTGTKSTSSLSPTHPQQSKGLSRQQLQLHAKQSFTFDEDEENWMVAPDKLVWKHHKFLANRSASITISSPPLSHFSRHAPLEHTRSHVSITPSHFPLGSLSHTDRRGSAPNPIKSEKLKTFDPPMEGNLRSSTTSFPSIFPQFPRQTSSQPLSRTGVTHNLATSTKFPSQLQRETVGSTLFISDQRSWFPQQHRQQEHFRKPGPSRQDSGISTLSSISRSDIQY